MLVQPILNQANAERDRGSVATEGDVEVEALSRRLSLLPRS